MIWEEGFKPLLEGLGKDGMSSDESDVDPTTGETTFIVKELPWRVDVKEELDTIDLQRKKNRSARVRRGAQPSKRIRLAKGPSSIRPPPMGINRALVEKSWLKNCVAPEELRLSSKPFKVVKIRPGKGKGVSRGG